MLIISSKEKERNSIPRIFRTKNKDKVFQDIGNSPTLVRQKLESLLLFSFYFNINILNYKRISDDE